MTFRRHDREHGELEDALRQSRPTPPHELLDRLVARAARNAPVGGPARAPRRTFRRPVLGIAFASVFLAVFAGFGGLGYASSVVSGATHGARVTFSGVGGASGSVGKGAESNSSNRSGGDSDVGGISRGWQSSSAHHQYPRFRLVCIITPRRDIPIILLAPVADILIDHGVAHAPPCNVRPT